MQINGTIKYQDQFTKIKMSLCSRTNKIHRLYVVINCFEKQACVIRDMIIPFNNKVRKRF